MNSFSPGARIEKNSLSQSVVGIEFVDTGRVHMEKNSISDTVVGIDPEGEAGFNEIEQNTITNSSYAGIRLFSNSRNLIAGNSVSSSRQGMDIGGSFNTIENNVLAGNTEAGIVAHGSESQIIANTAVKNGQDGIHVSGLPESVLGGNVTNENGDDGIDVANSPETTLTGNTANRNFDLGIEAGPGVIDGGGNHAFGNGNPLQCLNVVCK